MKKIFTTLFATAAVFCASAAVPTYETDPTSGSTIEDRAEFKVTFTFSEEVKADSAQLVGGARFNSQLVTVATTKRASNIIEVTVPADAWGTASAGEYLLEVVLPEVYDSKGNLIQESDKDEETDETFYYPYTPRTNYISPDKTPAAYVGVDPDPAYTSVWDAYYDGWGAVDFAFSNVVELTGANAGARVSYVIDGEVTSKTVSVDEIWADWNMWTGNYGLSVPIPAIEDLEEEDLESITITLNGVVSNSKDITVAPVTYRAISANNIKKAPKTAGISLINEASSFDIYSIDGSVVKHNANNSDLKNIKNGIYVINGKKVIVK